jgi:hypothetical protein
MVQIEKYAQDRKCAFHTCPILFRFISNILKKISEPLYRGAVGVGSATHVPGMLVGRFFFQGRVYRHFHCSLGSNDSRVVVHHSMRSSGFFTVPKWKMTAFDKEFYIKEVQIKVHAVLILHPHLMVWPNHLRKNLFSGRLGKYGIWWSLRTRRSR